MSVSLVRIAVVAALTAVALPVHARTLEDQAHRARPSETDAPDLEEDEPIESFDEESEEPEEGAAPARKAVVEPSLSADGKEPLADNYRPSILSTDKDSVTVELPVLVAKSRSGFTEPMLLIADVLIGTNRVGHLQQSFDAASVAELGPTFAFFKAVAPVVDKEGEVKIEVRKAKPDGSEATVLFTRVVSYDL